MAKFACVLATIKHFLADIVCVMVNLAKILLTKKQFLFFEGDFPWRKYTKVITLIFNFF